MPVAVQLKLKLRPAVPLQLEDTGKKGRQGKLQHEACCAIEIGPQKGEVRTGQVRGPSLPLHSRRLYGSFLLHHTREG